MKQRRVYIYAACIDPQHFASRHREGGVRHHGTRQIQHGTMGSSSVEVKAKLEAFSLGCILLCAVPFSVHFSYMIAFET